MAIEFNAAQTPTQAQAAPVTTDAARAATAEAGAAKPQEAAAATGAKNESVNIQRIIRDALLAMGMKPTEENTNMARQIFNNNMPLDKETLQIFNRIMKLLNASGGANAAQAVGTSNAGNMSNAEKAMFMLQNEIPPTLKNAAMVNGYAAGNIKIAAQLETLLKSLDGLADPALKNAVLKALTGNPTNGGNTTGTATAQGNAAQGTAAQTATAQATAPQTQQTTAQTATGQAPTANTAQTAQATQATVPQAATAQAAAPQTAAGAQATTAQAQQSAAQPQQATAQTPIAQVPTAPQASQATTAQAQAASNPAEELLKALGEYQAKSQTVQGDSLQKPEVAQNPAEAAHTNTERARLAHDLSFTMRNTTPKDADAFLSRMQEKLQAAQTEVAAHTGADAQRVSRDIAQIQDNLNFLNQLGSQARESAYIQIPIPMQNGAETAELLVFRDKKNKNKGGASSALIGLNTAYLGRFEAFVQKNERNVNCQFRLESERIEKLVKSKLPELNNLLSEHNYSMSYTFKQITESFTLLNKKPEEENLVPVVQERLVIDVRT